MREPAQPERTVSADKPKDTKIAENRDRKTGFVCIGTSDALLGMPCLYNVSGTPV